MLIWQGSKGQVLLKTTARPVDTLRALWQVRTLSNAVQAARLHGFNTGLTRHKGQTHPLLNTSSWGLGRLRSIQGLPPIMP